MAFDVSIINFIHQYVSDRFIFDAELVWLVLSIATAVAPPSVTEKMPSWVMVIINAVTLHWENSKRSDTRGKRKY